ncbi:MAG: DUF1906 domain-containing protein [Bacillota bacterium]|nr:DUF1906 domain-containing protein [Bacillota bacterium]
MGFVARYDSVNVPAKNRTRREARAFSAVGLWIVTVWENGSPTSRSSFTFSRGCADVRDAFSLAADEVGQPDGSPIYFAVDYDALTRADRLAVGDDFRGLHEGAAAWRARRQARGWSAPSYPVGVYGGWYVLQWLWEERLADRFWQATAPAWSRAGTPRAGRGTTSGNASRTRPAASSSTWTDPGGTGADGGTLWPRRRPLEAGVAGAAREVGRMPHMTLAAWQAFSVWYLASAAVMVFGVFAAIVIRGSRRQGPQLELIRGSAPSPVVAAPVRRRGPRKRRNGHSQAEPPLRNG